MVLVRPSLISEIDKYAALRLGIPTRTLMARAGHAVANAVRAYCKKGSSVSVFVGKGNNGGDGYAAALELMTDYSVTVYDVFSEGQRTEEGRYFLDSFTAMGGRVQSLTLAEKQIFDIRSSHCVVDAVFGTGFCGELPAIAISLVDLFSSMSTAVKIAVDVPLGINADLGTLASGNAYRADATVSLGFVKRGLLSYPAKEYVGKIIYDNIGLQNDDILPHFEVNDYAIDFDLASKLLPVRPADSHKGTFGKLLIIAGSETYVGAAHLALEAALRSGVGYVTYVGDRSLCDSLVTRLPEAIYRPLSLHSDGAIDSIAELAKGQSAILIGPGLGTEQRAAAYDLIERLAAEDGAPLILDADAINALGEKAHRAIALMAHSRRPIILTPHPAELTRLTGVPANVIQRMRLEISTDFAAMKRVILVLKGAGTIVTDGRRCFINTSGSSALAKAGSGDVLAGHLAALVATLGKPLEASALAVYLHGAAADTLASELSELGVIPSDLPRAIAREIRALEEHRDKQKE
jgi:NAD(P)H-hydrate epimerase